jgi:uncharacterized small protein (DUF1192 family)
METLRKEVVASVELFEARISEDELAVCESALSYALDSLGDAEIERRLGATRDEVEGVRDDLRAALRAQSEVEPLAEMT